MQLDELETLIEYHYWARDRLLAAVATLPPEQFTEDRGNSFPSVRDTLAHLIGAEWVWCARWMGESPQFPPSTEYQELTDIRRAWVEQERKIRAVLQRLGPEDVSKLVEYTGFSGHCQSQPFWQMLQHLVNHGSYHRGQVTTMLRQLGAAPPKSLDLIAFYRERANVPT
jgi:uncharacterized damage-inducible protein DinB